MTIKKLELSNFQCIERFEQEFEGNVYLVTGDNELGKSTLLKAIGALLTGNRDDVLRNGADKGFAKMVVGDDGNGYEVTLSFTKTNPRGTLSIKSADGMKSNNVSMLQKVFGYQDFDAVEFSRWSETAEGRRKQIQVVKNLLPAEVVREIEEIDRKRAEIYDKRTEANRVANARATIADDARKGLTDQDIATCTELINVAELIKEQGERDALKAKANDVRKTLEMRKQQIADIPTRMQALEDWRKEEYEAYQNALKVAEDAWKNAQERIADEAQTIKQDEADYTARRKNCEEWLSKYESERPNDDGDLTERLGKANDHNAKVKQVADYKAKAEEQAKADAEVNELESQMFELLARRAELVNNADLPIKGLTFTEDGLELNGIPFVAGKVSDSQIMEIATQLIIESNPTVKVFRIARGESLGAKRLQAIVDMAHKYGFQGFIEQVQRGQNAMYVEEYTELS